MVSRETNSEGRGARKERSGVGNPRLFPPGFGGSGSGSRAWGAYLVLGILASSAFYLLPYSVTKILVYYNAVGISAVAAVVIGVRVCRPARPLAWYLFAAGLLMFVVGDTMFSYYEQVLEEDPFPSLADAFYLGGYPLIAGGLLILVRGRTPGGDRTGFVDATIIATGLGILSWVFLMAPYTRDPELTLIESSVLISYPLADVLLLAILVRFMVAPGSRTPAYYLLGLSLTVLLISDVSYGVAELAGTFEGGGLIDTSFLLSYVLWGAAALHPSMSALSEPAPERAARPSRKRLAVLAGVSLMAPAVLAIQATRSAQEVDVPAIVGGSVVLFSLVLVRAEGLLRTLTTALITREQAEQALRESEQRFRQLFENSVDVLFVHDAEGRVLDCNSAACRSLGYTREELLALRVKDLTPGLIASEERRATEGDTLWERVMCGEPGTIVGFVRNDLRRKDRTIFPAEVGVGAIDYGGRRLIFASARDITERKTLEERLAQQAFYDSLTRLPNRALFMDRLEHALARTARCEGNVAVLFMDLDDFKDVNDSLGHEAGDELLVKVAERLSRCLRPTDTAARLGGDEFTILLEDVEEPSQATRTAERIAGALQAPFTIEGQELFVTTSIGVALGSSTEDRPEGLLRNADLAMYQAKAKGKNHYAVFAPSMNARVLQRLGLANDLRRAIDGEEFKVYYQPRVLVKSGEIVGMEALVRWEHPERGLVFPTEFIPVAEESGLIVPLGCQVIEEACRQAREWHVRYPGDPPLTMSVNLSAKQFNRPDLVETVARILDESGLEPRFLTLEITESVMVEDVHAVIETLKRLKALGVKIAVDDFGTGYSSLSYLKCFPVDFLKIDRSFVSGLGDNPTDEGLVSAVLDLSRALGLQAVAEGVETQDQLFRLSSLGCELAQGYYFWRPLSGEAASRLLATDSGRFAARESGVHWHQLKAKGPSLWHAWNLQTPQADHEGGAREHHTTPSRGDVDAAYHHR